MIARAAAPDRRWRNVPLSRERDVRRARRMWTLLTACVVAFSPFAVYLLEQMQHVQLRYRVESLRADSRRLTEAERRLRVQAASLESPRTVEAHRENIGRKLGIRTVAAFTRFAIAHGMLEAD